MSEREHFQTVKRVVLLQVVDRRKTPISGVRVDCFEDGKKIATLKSGKKAIRYEPNLGTQVRFVAHYGGYPPHEGSPDAHGMCEIRFPEVDLLPDPILLAEPAHITAGKSILIVTLALAGAFGLGCIFGGIQLMAASGAGETTFDFFGLKFSTKQAGVAAIALGAATIILTFRKVLKTVVDLGRI